MDILTPDAELNKYILEEVKKTLQSAFRSAVPKIKQSCQDTLVKYLKNAPEYHFLKDGPLREELGIEDPQVVDNIITQIKDKVSIHQQDIQIGTNGLTGGFTVLISEMSIQEMIALPDASYPSRSKRTGIISTVTWLEWLLTYGSVVPVPYGFYLKNRPGFSRTSAGIMVTTFKGNDWVVPPEFQGTESNNWLTRALAGKEEEFAGLIAGELLRAI